MFSSTALLTPISWGTILQGRQGRGSETLVHEAWAGRQQRTALRSGLLMQHTACLSLH